MIREKHECSLLKVFSDAGSTPAASTTSNHIVFNNIMEIDDSVYDTRTIAPSCLRSIVAIRSVAQSRMTVIGKRCSCPMWVEGTV